MYKIKCYVSAGGKNEIQETYNNGTDELQAEIFVEIEYLRVRNRKDWTRPHAAKLNKCQEFRDFFEIRIYANKVENRPIGYFGPGNDDFTILVWAIEKGNKFIPSGWCEKANRRRKEIENGLAKSEELKLDDE